MIKASTIIDSSSLFIQVLSIAEDLKATESNRNSEVEHLKQ